MSLSMYQASAPVFTRVLGNLSRILDKGAAFAESRKIEPSVLINSRLAPDMLPLSKQVQIASDMVIRGSARLAGVDIPSSPDTETTFVHRDCSVPNPLNQSAPWATIGSTLESVSTLLIRVSRP